MISIFLADDHAIVRSGLRRLIEDQPDMRVIGEASDGRQVLLAEAKERWDVLVLDLSLPRVSGIEVLRRLHAELPRLRIVILSMYPAPQYAPRMLKAGACAYLSKAQDASEMVTALRIVARGGTYVSPALGAKLPADSVKPGSGSVELPHAALSAREYQVFTLIFQGRTVTEIAAELNLSASTISNHIARIKEKLGTHSIAEIVNYAHRAGLVGSASE